MRRRQRNTQRNRRLLPLGAVASTDRGALFVAENGQRDRTRNTTSIDLDWSPHIENLECRPLAAQREHVRCRYLGWIHLHESGSGIGSHNYDKYPDPDNNATGREPTIMPANWLMTTAVTNARPHHA